QFTAAPVTAGAIAGAQEIATQFWQKAEAERQKAREEEAAAALQKCQEVGGCGAQEGQEEEGAPVDPTEESIYTWQETKKFAKNLREEADELGLDVLAGVVVPYIGDFVSGGLGALADQYRVWAKNLEGCALAAEYFKPKGMCWVRSRSVELKIGEVYWSIEEQPCPWTAGHKKGLEWFDCGRRGEWQG
ncbi:MAG TPA: hypothetical protein VIJ50_02735, partial [Solirubrobacteraceae bacterium]